MMVQLCLLYTSTVLDDDIDPVDATMIVTFREVLSCIRYFGIQPSDSVVVIGCGPVGLTYIKSVSYTHLDVYKRQVSTSVRASVVFQLAVSSRTTSMPGYSSTCLLYTSRCV